MTCADKESEIKIKMIQGQWLQLKMMLFLGYIEQENCYLGLFVEGELSPIFFLGKILEHRVSLNPLVLPGAIPASAKESFIVPDINIKGKKTPRTSTKSNLTQAINI